MTTEPLPITITLDNGAHACGLTSTSKSGSICDLARQLISAGHNPEALAIIYRGATLCFNPSQLKTWAKLAVREDAQRSTSFVKWSPMPEALTG